jgi:hypothetical protein
LRAKRPKGNKNQRLSKTRGLTVPTRLTAIRRRRRTTVRRREVKVVHNFPSREDQEEFRLIKILYKNFKVR